MKLIVNLPAYNEEKNIADTIKRIPRELIGVTEVLVQVIDDGSHDRTVEEARDAGADIVVSHNGNRGLGVMFATMRESALTNGADIVVNMDADGQFDPLEIQMLIDPILAGTHDMVLADRFGTGTTHNIPYAKDRLNRLGAWLVGNALGTPVTDLTCGFRAHNREALLRLNDPTGFTYTQETIIDAVGKRLRLLWVPVTVTYHDERKSRVVKSIGKYVNDSARIIIKAFRDVRPMKFFGLPGFILIGLSVITFSVFLLLYFPDLEVTRYRNYLFTAIALFLIGMQLVIFALIADMVKGSRQLSEEILYQRRKDKYPK